MNTKLDLAWKIAEHESGKVFQACDYRKPTPRVKQLMRLSKDRLFANWVNIIKNKALT